MAARATYCGNVHAAEDLASWFEQAERFALPIAKRRRDSTSGAFGLGVWWNARMVESLLGDQAACERLRAWFRDRDVELWTMNVFPFGSFHAETVKLGVYEPDWASEERLQYTLQTARIAAGIVEPGRTVALSTLPLGYGDGDARRCARNLARAASGLAAIADMTGVEFVLALEPEPFCRCETVVETAEFLTERVFGAPDAPVAEDVLRRHLGVCIDLCHLAVVGEEPIAAARDLERRGIRMPKVQVSSCLELRDPANRLDELLEFDEDRYVHQTVSFDGALRALDLGEVRARRAEFERESGLRTHFHMPIYWDADAALGSTRRQVEHFLAWPGLRSEDAPLLEIETYTWSVLGEDWRPERDLVGGILREFEFLDRALGLG